MTIDLSSSDLSPGSDPPWNFRKVSPVSVSLRLLEITIHDDILVSSLLEKLNIVDCESKTIRGALTFKLEYILTDLCLQLKGKSVDVIVRRLDIRDNNTVPTYGSPATIKSYSVSAEPL